MKRVLIGLAAASGLYASAITAEASQPTQTAPGAASGQPTANRPSGPLQQKLAPGLARYTDEVLFGQVWPSRDLSQRDRSLVVISALIATNKPAQLTGHLGRALDNGVTPLEASGLLTHLALYSGWPNAVSALEVYDRVYTARNIDTAALQAPVGLLQGSSSPAGAATDDRVRPVAPKFSRLTDEVVFGDLWRRSDLSVRDRSLVTIATLVATGDADMLAPYLRRGVEDGLTCEEIAEAVTHLAFYVGWPKATKAMEVVSRIPTAPRVPANR